MPELPPRTTPPAIRPVAMDKGIADAAIQYREYFVEKGLKPAVAAELTQLCLVAATVGTAIARIPKPASKPSKRGRGR